MIAACDLAPGDRVRLTVSGVTRWWPVLEVEPSTEPGYTDRVRVLLAEAGQVMLAPNLEVSVMLADPAPPAPTVLTSPPDVPDLLATLDRADLAALLAGRPVHVEAQLNDDPHGTPGATLRLVLEGTL